MVESRWVKEGPSIQAIYGNMQKGMEVEITATSKAAIKKMHQQWEVRSEQEGMFKKSHNNYTIYGGGDEKGHGMALLLNNATVMIEGNVEMKQMLSAFDTLPLKKIEELAKNK